MDAETSAALGSITAETMELREQIVGGQPTLGRIVHVTTRNPEGGFDVAPAMITRICGDDRINVTVFDGNGTTYPLKSISFDASSVELNTWRWPARV